MGEKNPYQYYDQIRKPVKEGPLEGGACVWLIRREEDKTFILFQKRSEFVQNAGFYDASAGGHIDEGEDPLTTAIRETKEEIGLTLTPEELHFVCEYATDEKLISVYLTDRTGKNDEFVLDKEEVESIEWIELADLDMFIRARVKPPLRELLPHIPVLRYYIENYL